MLCTVKHVRNSTLNARDICYFHFPSLISSLRNGITLLIHSPPLSPMICYAVSTTTNYCGTYLVRVLFLEFLSALTGSIAFYTPFGNAFKKENRYCRKQEKVLTR